MLNNISDIVYYVQHICIVQTMCLVNFMYYILSLFLLVNYLFNILLMYRYRLHNHVSVCIIYIYLYSIYYYMLYVYYILHLYYKLFVNFSFQYCLPNDLVLRWWCVIYRRAPVPTNWWISKRGSTHSEGKNCPGHKCED